MPIRSRATRSSATALSVTTLAAIALAAGLLAAAVPASAQEYGYSVPAGTRLVGGDRMTTSGGAFTLTVQTDGNVVERRGTAAVWVTGTQGNRGATLSVQTDGNLVVRSAAGQALWVSGTAGHPAAKLSLEDDGLLLLWPASGEPIWTNGYGQPVRRSTLGAGQSIRSSTDESALDAPHGRFRLYAMQGLHLSEYANDFEAETWTPSRAGTAAGSLTLQTDGNLVYRDTRGVALWVTGTRGAGLRLTLQDDGNLVLRRPDGGAVWSTGTTRVLLAGGETAGPGTRFVLDRSVVGLAGVTTVQTDGNVVTRTEQGRVTWSTGTAGNAGARLVQQTDGNLVVRRADGRAVWQSGTSRCDQPVVFDTTHGWLWERYTVVWTTTGGSKGYC